MTATHGGDLFAVARRNRWDWREVLDCSASINPLGPSPGVRTALQNGLERIVHYPEREPVELREKLAAVWDVHPEQILLGNGATELIYFLARTGAAARPACIGVPAFSEFHRAFADARQVPLDNPAGWPTDRLLILTRPANPTGTTLPFEMMARWLGRTENPVIVDESFLDFTGHRSMAALLGQRRRLMILRSLTKFYALPGLRVGALLAEESTVREWQARREPWQVNVLAEAAALAALGDRAHSERTVAFVAAEREWLSEALREMPGVQPQPSDANFLLVRLAYPAAALAAFLEPRKILVRICTGWPGVEGETVRIAVRQRAENQHLLEGWRFFPCD